MSTSPDTPRASAAGQNGNGAARERATRVVIVDNSATLRQLLADGLRDRGLEIVGAASDGRDALRVIEQTRPDVVSLDYMMPELDGLGVLRGLRDRGLAVPTVIVTSVQGVAAERAVEMLTEGAVEVVPKPLPGASPAAFLDELREQLELAAHARVKPHPHEIVGRRPPERRRIPGTRRLARRRVVVIAASTGGPQALRCILGSLPNRIGTGTIIVQHMPARFTPRLAVRLDSDSLLNVREAAEGDRLNSSNALLAPGGLHLRIANGTVTLTTEPPIGGLRPRADVTIADAAKAYGKDVMLIVLTGMGRDGLQGARLVKSHGGIVVAESEDSAVVYGMPRAIVEAGLADAVLPSIRIADAIEQEAGW